MLIANWWQVLKRAWSIRWIVVAGLLSGLEVFLPIVDGYVASSSIATSALVAGLKIWF